MGWREGEGLGKHRDGCTDHLIVSAKTDTVGLGATKRVDLAQETYCQLTAFDSILRRLNGQGEGKEDPADRESPGEAAQAGQKQGDERGTAKRDRKGQRSRAGERPREDDGAPVRAVSSRLAHRKRFIANKRVEQYSREQLREILGTVPE